MTRAKFTRVSTTEKYCAKCQQTHPLSNFHCNRNRADGLQYWCKVCMKQYTVDN